MLNGNKTYIGVGLIAASQLAKGFIPAVPVVWQDVLMQLSTLLETAGIIFGGVGIRHALKKNEAAARKE